MNGIEQKNHKTAVDGLRAEVAALADTFDVELNERLQPVRRELERLDSRIAENQHHAVTTLATQQRDYVDREDAALRTCCQERWDATSTAQSKIIALALELPNAGFWSRLRWLVTGRMR